MEKKKHFYVNTGLESKMRDLPIPKAKDKAVCLCCKRPLRTITRGSNWNSETNRFETTPETKWFYVGHTYFCTQRCGIIYGTMAADKKLKISIKD